MERLGPFGNADHDSERIHDGVSRMIPTAMKEYLFHETAAPKVITSDVQFEEYVSTLLELDEQSYLTAAERNFAELLVVLIQDYVEKNNSARSVTLVGYLQELLSANGFWQNN